MQEIYSFWTKLPVFLTRSSNSSLIKGLKEMSQRKNYSTPSQVKFYEDKRGANNFMSKFLFHDPLSLAEQTEALGKKAINLGLISSFIVRYYSDSQEFYLADEDISIPLTPPEAYMKLKKLVEGSLSKV